MKQNKLLQTILLFITPIIFLFPLFFIINGKNNSCLDLLIYKDNIYVILLSTFPIICVYLGSLLSIFNKTSKYAFIPIFISFLFLVFFPNILDKLLALEVDLKIGYFALTFYVLFLLLYLLKDTFDNLSLSVRDIVEIGVFTAIAVILDLSFFKIRIGQNGGSISLSMLPLFLLSYRKGFFKGFVGCGIVFGLVTCLIDGYGLFTYPFDYLLGFGSIAVVGLFNKIIFDKNKKLSFRYILLTISVVVAIVLRTLFATISGMVFYGLTFAPSLLYQITYILPSGGAVLVCLILLYKPFLFQTN